MLNPRASKKNIVKTPTLYGLRETSRLSGLDNRLISQGLVRQNLINPVYKTVGGLNKFELVDVVYCRLIYLLRKDYPIRILKKVWPSCDELKDKILAPQASYLIYSVNTRVISSAPSLMGFPVVSDLLTDAVPAEYIRINTTKALLDDKVSKKDWCFFYLDAIKKRITDR